MLGNIPIRDPLPLDTGLLIDAATTSAPPPADIFTGERKGIDGRVLSRDEYDPNSLHRLKFRTPTPSAAGSPPPTASGDATGQA
jgi:hypothetical protein